MKIKKERVKLGSIHAIKGGVFAAVGLRRSERIRQILYRHQRAAASQDQACGPEKTSSPKIKEKKGPHRDKQGINPNGSVGQAMERCAAGKRNQALNGGSKDWRASRAVGRTRMSGDWKEKKNHVAGPPYDTKEKRPRQYSS